MDHKFNIQKSLTEHQSTIKLDISRQSSRKSAWGYCARGLRALLPDRTGRYGSIRKNSPDAEGRPLRSRRMTFLRPGGRSMSIQPRSAA